MATFQRERLVGIVVDLVAAAALTGVGVVLHMIVNKRASMGMLEVLALASVVMAVLKLHLWALDKAGSDSTPMQIRPARTTRRSPPDKE